MVGNQKQKINLYILFIVILFTFCFFFLFSFFFSFFFYNIQYLLQLLLYIEHSQACEYAIQKCSIVEY